ncbi:unnamed protein product [Blepharisma stoltei]|uniref:Uncharacterized protein n=1 Tax=Blepharisma stoltei TaxID=1481888 RepID=A0AAU9ISG9_9CILI|nr:unnamed protein product [Blepharisma stoltei]
MGQKEIVKQSDAKLHSQIFLKRLLGMQRLKTLHLLFSLDLWNSSEKFEDFDSESHREVSPSLSSTDES